MFIIYYLLRVLLFIIMLRIFTVTVFTTLKNVRSTRRKSEFLLQHLTP